MVIDPTRKIGLRDTDNKNVILAMRQFMDVVRASTAERITAGELLTAAENICNLLKEYCDPNKPCDEFLKEFL